MTLTCSSCGASLRSTSKICIKCGELISASNNSENSRGGEIKSKSNIENNSSRISVDPPVFEQPPEVVSMVAASKDNFRPLNGNVNTSIVKGSFSNTIKITSIAFTLLIIGIISWNYFAASNRSSSTTQDVNKFISSTPTDSSQSVSSLVRESNVDSSAAVVPVCKDINDCLLVTLRAAVDEDVELVRRVAGRIDDLEKPPQGNRPLSRKINAEALSAFGREDFSAAVDLFKNAYQENPRDVEIAANYGFALVRVRQLNDAISVLTQALILDPRRTSTWTPIAESYALLGKPNEAISAMWVGYQWSNDREKSLNYYESRILKEQGQSREFFDLYTNMLAWARGNKPAFVK